jgi:hypothetical protein
MIDTGLIVETLRRRGHTVESVIPTPENAGEYEFLVDGQMLSLEETRALMEDDYEKAQHDRAAGRRQPAAEVEPATAAVAPPEPEF